jgi:hypothetical protein
MLIPTAIHRATRAPRGAAQAFVPPLFPDLGLKFQVHQFRYNGHVNLRLELGLDLLFHFLEVQLILFRDLLASGAVHHHIACIGVDRYKISLPDIGQEEVETAQDHIGVHRMAEAIFQRLMIEPDDNRIAAPREVVRVGIDAFHHDLIQFSKGVDVTGSHPNDYPRVDRILDLLVPVCVAQIIGG